MGSSDNAHWDEKVKKVGEAQEKPTTKDPRRKPVGEFLKALIDERTRVGIEKYGEALHSFNGRDAMQDALQESLDLNQYLAQRVMEVEQEIQRLRSTLRAEVAARKVTDTQAVGEGQSWCDGIDTGEKCGYCSGCLREKLQAAEQASEAYPEGWLHCMIHLNPKSGEMHSDGDHSVREHIEKRIARLEGERDHWKANHDEQVRQKQALLDRPDLADRAKSVQRLIAEAERLRRALERISNRTELPCQYGECSQAILDDRYRAAAIAREVLTQLEDEEGRSYYDRETKAAAQGRADADRMAKGEPCIPQEPKPSEPKGCPTPGACSCKANEAAIRRKVLLEAKKEIGNFQMDCYIGPSVIRDRALNWIDSELRKLAERLDQ